MPETVLASTQPSQYERPVMSPVLDTEPKYVPAFFTRQHHGSTETAINPPNSERADDLLQTTFNYVQARYCIVDWVQLQEWHQARDLYLASNQQSNVEAQTAAFFLWLVYAIGVRLLSDVDDGASEAYFERACAHLPTVTALQDIVTVQALLCMIQYSFRARKGPALWDLVRSATSLCVKLKLHRSLSRIRNKEALNPYNTELRKRFWWCAYCFDRSVIIARCSATFFNKISQDCIHAGEIALRYQ